MISQCKVLDPDDFADPDFVATLRAIFPHEVERFGPAWPRGREYAKVWEVGMAVSALRAGGALRADAEILGVGAGNEPTIFYLTNHVRRVFSTDLYLTEPPPRPQSEPGGFFHRVARAAFRPGAEPARAWAESANTGMFLHPERYWPGPWNPRRLVVQHMNGLDLRYEDGTFDGIFSNGSIEHFGGYPEVRQAAREMARVLKPGGILSLSTEFRLDGPSPGIPGVLMFDRAELTEHVAEASGLQPLAPFDSTGIAQARAAARVFDRQLENVRRHVAEHGEILFHKLTWPEGSSVALRHEGRVWTSCHLAFRK
jgi:SAM-dependent methyltransferase